MAKLHGYFWGPPEPRDPANAPPGRSWEGSGVRRLEIPASGLGGRGMGFPALDKCSRIVKFLVFYGHVGAQNVYFASFLGGPLRSP